MTTLQEHLAHTTIHAETPDGIAFGSIRADSEISFSLVPGYYQHADDARVADKVVQLARVLWVARVKEFYALKSELLGRTIRTEPEPRTETQRRRTEARNSIVASGTSRDGTVEISAVGLLNWSVQIRPGTVPRVPEEQFCRSVKEAAEGLVRNHLEQLREVWAQRYGEWQGTPVARRGNGPLPPPRRAF